MFSFKKAHAAQCIIDKLVVRSQQRGYTVATTVTGSCVILTQGHAIYRFFDVMAWINFLRADCDQSGSYEHDAHIDELVKRSQTLQFNIAQDIRSREIILRHQSGAVLRVQTLEIWERYLDRFAQTFRVNQ